MFSVPSVVTPRSHRLQWAEHRRVNHAVRGPAGGQPPRPGKAGPSRRELLPGAKQRRAGFLREFHAKLAAVRVRGDTCETEWNPPSE